MQKALKLLEIIKNEYIKILKDNLIGIYIHGSLAFKCFNWEKSDIDFLVIIKNDIKLNEKEKLIKILLENDKNSTKKGFVMSIILEKYCINFIYPTPYILHYSNSYKEEFKKNLSYLCESRYCGIATRHPDAFPSDSCKLWQSYSPAIPETY